MIPDPSRRERIEVLFDQCSELPPEQRSRFLEVAVAGDLDLRREVEALLASAERAESTGRLERIVAAAFDLPRQPSVRPATGDRYELLDRLGGGGMGTVYKARERRSGRLVALKFLSESLAEDPVLKRRFQREARAAAALEHPNIGAIHGVEESQDGRLFIVMPFYAGGTLKQRIAKGPLPVNDAVTCAVQVAEGLALAHGWGIIHRDIKPANLVFDADGSLKILDFGIAKMGGEKLTRTGLVLGTLAYMSPEQATGGTVDHRTDLWALGVVLHEMLAGRPPFSAPSIEQLFRAVRFGDLPLVRETRPEVPEPVQAVVTRLLQREPEKRYPDAQAVAAALRS
ncbi:MAG TPA: serine/threonine-protein kinase [Gemmatimonadales bacterium]|nr:serine/threonine-protein kinase [Gemmatimonadales bacterium]